MSEQGSRGRRRPISRRGRAKGARDLHGNAENSPRSSSRRVGGATGLAWKRRVVVRRLPVGIRSPGEALSAIENVWKGKELPRIAHVIPGKKSSCRGTAAIFELETEKDALDFCRALDGAVILAPNIEEGEEEEEEAIKVEEEEEEEEEEILLKESKALLRKRDEEEKGAIASGGVVCELTLNRRIWSDNWQPTKECGTLHDDPEFQAFVHVLKKQEERGIAIGKDDNHSEPEVSALLQFLLDKDAKKKKRQQRQKERKKKLQQTKVATDRIEEEAKKAGGPTSQKRRGGKGGRGGSRGGRGGSKSERAKNRNHRGRRGGASASKS